MAHGVVSRSRRWAVSACYIAQGPWVQAQLQCETKHCAGGWEPGGSGATCYLRKDRESAV